MIAHKNERVFSRSHYTDLLFVTNLAGLFISGLRIFLLLLEQMSLHLKGKSFVPFLKLSEFFNSRLLPYKISWICH